MAIRPFSDLDVRAPLSLAWPAADPAPAVRSFVDAVRTLCERGVFLTPA